MKAGELTSDFLGTSVTAHDVGQTKRTVVLVLATIQHDPYGHAGAYRTILTDHTGQVVNVPSGSEIELSQ